MIFSIANYGRCIVLNKKLELCLCEARGVGDRNLGLFLKFWEAMEGETESELAFLTKLIQFYRRADMDYKFWTQQALNRLVAEHPDQAEELEEERRQANRVAFSFARMGADWLVGIAHKLGYHLDIANPEVDVLKVLLPGGVESAVRGEKIRDIYVDSAGIVRVICQDGLEQILVPGKYEFHIT